MTVIFAIASGGAIGALLRHFVGMASLRLFGAGFPYATLGVNILGSFLMGALIAYLAQSWSPPQEVRAFLTVGFLGAFTTFSTFSFDAVTLWERGEAFAALAYVLASVILSILALFAGLLIIRNMY